MHPSVTVRYDEWGRLHLFSRKNDELSKENYRPVTVLPALNNVFEKLLASQLDQFYSEILFRVGKTVTGR